MLDVASKAKTGAGEIAQGLMHCPATHHFGLNSQHHRVPQSYQESFLLTEAGNYHPENHRVQQRPPQKKKKTKQKPLLKTSREDEQRVIKGLITEF